MPKKITIGLGLLLLFGASVDAVCHVKNFFNGDFRPTPVVRTKKGPATMSGALLVDKPLLRLVACGKGLRRPVGLGLLLHPHLKRHAV